MSAPRIAEPGRAPGRDDLHATERSLGISLPEDYASFLLASVADHRERDEEVMRAIAAHHAAAVAAHARRRKLIELLGAARSHLAPASDASSDEIAALDAAISRAAVDS